MKLLYAIDIRDEALWHLDDVARWADRLGATVDFLYVNPVGDYVPYISDPVLIHALEVELDRAKALDLEKVEEALSHLPEARRGTAKVVVGEPAPTIAAEADGYDAVVLATRGRRGLKRLWLGSVAERVLRLHHGTSIVLHPG